MHCGILLPQIQPGITELSPKRDLIRARRPSQLPSEATSCGSDMTHTTTVSATLQYELHHIHQSASDMGMQWLLPRSRQPSSPLGVQQSGHSGRASSRHRLSTASTQRAMSMTVIPLASTTTSKGGGGLSRPNYDNHTNPLVQQHTGFSRTFRNLGAIPCQDPDAGAGLPPAFVKCIGKLIKCRGLPPAVHQPAGAKGSARVFWRGLLDPGTTMVTVSRDLLRWQIV